MNETFQCVQYLQGDIEGICSSQAKLLFACQWLEQLEETYGCLLDINNDDDDDDDDDDDGSNNQTLVSLP